MSSDARPIPLPVANKTAHIWDVDDIATIRSKYRLCGVLSGTLPHLAQQNVFLGVPLVLLPEETVLLVNIGAAVLVDDPNAYKRPTVLQLERWAAEDDKLARAQIILNETKAAKEKQSGRATSEEALRKRKEREQRRALTAKVTAEAGGEGSSESLFTPAEAAPVSQPLATSPSADGSKDSTTVAYTITIPASSSSLEWYDASNCTYSTIDAARSAGVWDYPATLSERARCGVFRDLWQKGYFMGGGIKFGGEYLVYPGDPLRYHSHFAATVLESPVASLRPMEIVAHGRLGTATKKAHLLCGWDDEKQEVSYLSIEWAGFG